MTNRCCICAFDWHQDQWPWSGRSAKVRIFSDFHSCDFAD